MKKIIFVCTGNTCRSPMAEGIFRTLNGEERLGICAASAGLYVQKGMSATPFAVQAAAELGADIAAHRACPLSETTVQEAEYLVCMTAAHLDRLLDLYPQAKDKTYVLMARDVDDPFGGDLSTYRRCAEQLQEGLTALIEGMERQNEN